MPIGVKYFICRVSQNCFHFVAPASAAECRQIIAEVLTDQNGCNPLAAGGRKKFARILPYQGCSLVQEPPDRPRMLREVPALSRQLPEICKGSLGINPCRSV